MRPDLGEKVLDKQINQKSRKDKGGKEREFTIGRRTSSNPKLPRRTKMALW